MGSGFVTLTVNDGGTAIAVPSGTLQVKIGIASGGTVPANKPTAGNSPAFLQSCFGYGDLLEASALSIAKGATIIAILAAIGTAGTAEAVQFAGTGTSVITTTLAGTIGAYSTFYVQMQCLAGGTIGTAPGPAVQLSLDAGRNFGPPIQLGAATTYTIPNTGITLDFATGTLVKGDVAQFATIGPKASTAGVMAALAALAASTYATGGWGSMHIVTPFDGADAQTINGYLDTAGGPAFFTNGLYTRSFLEARDAAAPTAWGGAGETESTWMASLGTDYSAASAKRIVVGAGYYNMPSALGSGLGMGGSVVGAPAYRRPGTWAAAARRIQTGAAAQRLISRVRDGNLDAIVQDPTRDPTDGFIYHDERTTPGLDYKIVGSGTNRFMAFMSRQGKKGFFVSNPLLMSPPGSQFDLLPKGDVIDIFCGILLSEGSEEINDDVRLTGAFTMNPNDAVSIQNEINGVATSQMTNAGMCTATSVVIDQTHVIGGPSGDGNVPITGTLVGKGYILSETISVNLQ
jgi:hypothetical protein